MGDKRAHSELGASGMYRWSACPGSVRLCRALPPVPDSAYAAEGTAAHDIAAKCLAGALDAKTYSTVYSAVPLDQDTVDAVQTYLDYVRSQCGQDDELLIEHAFDLSAIHQGCFGTADAVIYKPAEKHLIAADYKHGAGIPVEVKGNPQLRYYALGALLETRRPAEKVTYAVVQPRCFHPDGPVRTETVDAIELLEFASDLARYAKATEAPNAPLMPGDHCRFCPAAYHNACPALEEKSRAIARLEFQPAQTYEPAKLAEGLALADLLEFKIKQIREFAYQEAMHGRIPPGWKLVPKRAIRLWKNPQETRQYLAMAGADPAAYLTAPELKSPAQVEKALSKLMFATLKPGIAAEPSGFTLVPESDKRPAVVLDAKHDFLPVNEK